MGQLMLIYCFFYEPPIVRGGSVLVFAMLIWEAVSFKPNIFPILINRMSPFPILGVLVFLSLLYKYWQTIIL